MHDVQQDLPCGWVLNFESAVQAGGCACVLALLYQPPVSSSMNRFANVVTVATCLLTAAFSVQAQTPKDNPKCVADPVFSRFPGEYLQSCEQSRFASLSLSRRKDLNNPRSDLEYFKVEGEYWYNNNGLAGAGGQKPSKLEVQRNFETAVKQANGFVLSIDEGSGQVRFHIPRPDGDFWGIVGCGGSDGTNCNSVFHKTVRVAPMKQDIVVSADQIAKDMGNGGKVVFYGIYFDTDKATIKPESAATLAEMAKWFNANAASKVFIVGHTDMQGAVDHNMGLSRNRAAAVVAALTAQHGIAKDRMSADGVGPLAPVASNANEASRAKNRRVEMVLR
jgi:outer membrane protein OmpA-like peptidoglycan-associated protein